MAIWDLSGDSRADIVAVGSSVNVLRNELLITTTTHLASSVNPSHVNQHVEFTATITTASAVPDGSSVTFYERTTQIGTATTTKGVAHLTTSFGTAGHYVMKATFGGDSRVPHSKFRVLCEIYGGTAERLTLDYATRCEGWGDRQQENTNERPQDFVQQ